MPLNLYLAGCYSLLGSAVFILPAGLLNMILQDLFLLSGSVRTLRTVSPDTLDWESRVFGLLALIHFAMPNPCSLTILVDYFQPYL